MKFAESQKIEERNCAIDINKSLYNTLQKQIKDVKTEYDNYTQEREIEIEKQKELNGIAKTLEGQLEIKLATTTCDLEKQSNVISELRDELITKEKLIEKNSATIKEMFTEFQTYHSKSVIEYEKEQQNMKNNYEAQLKERDGLIEKEREKSLSTDKDLLIKTQNIVALKKENEEQKRYKAQISTEMIFYQESMKKSFKEIEMRDCIMNKLKT